MLESSSSVGASGSTPNVTPTPIGPTPAQNAFDTPVRTLNDLKNVLIANLGEQQGTQMYNGFILSILSGGFTTLQGASDQAAQAAKKMSQPEAQ